MQALLRHPTTILKEEEKPVNQKKGHKESVKNRKIIERLAHYNCPHLGHNKIKIT